MSQVDQETPIITKSIYRQIDFLRLFRLCKELGLVQRKRKMPVDYNSSNVEYNDKSGRSSCRRLLRLVIMDQFPEEHFKIRSNHDGYYIELPRELRQRINYYYSHIERFERNTPEAARVVHLYESINIVNFEHIHVNLPYKISIIFSSPRRSLYTRKPSEDFYQTAMDVISYRRILDENYDRLIQAIDEWPTIQARINREREQRIQERRRQQEAEEQQRMERLREQENERLRNLEILSRQIQEQRQNVANSSQEAFDLALQNLIERRRSDGN